MSRSRNSRGFKNSPVITEQRLWENLFRDILEEIALNRYQWIGMPDSIDTRFIELTLMRNPPVLFYFDDRYEKFLALRGMAGGKINMYDNPTSFRTVANGIVNRDLSYRECVPIWPNIRRKTEYDIIRLYSQLLAETQQTLNINVRAMRLTKLVAADETERLSFDNFNREINAGEPVVWLTEGFASAVNGGKFSVFDLGVDKEQVLSVGLIWARFWNEAMTMLGINNANQEKRERLVVEEVSANDEQIYSVRQTGLRARQLACEQINAMFNLSLSVRWNTDIELRARDMFLEQSQGVE